MPINNFTPSSRIINSYRGVGNVDFGQFREPLSQLAQSTIDDLFRPGGAVENATGSALRRTVETGFGPRSGGFDAARLNILSGARDQVANTVGQGALALAPLALQQRESQFGAASTIEQLRLAEEQLAQNQRVLDEALQRGECGIGDRLSGGLSGVLGGATAGSSIPGLGTLAGGIIGGIGGLFGGC